jgi:hypothetical protein
MRLKSVMNQSMAYLGSNQAEATQRIEHQRCHAALEYVLVRV